MTGRANWYDGVWLDAYHSARDVVAEVAPDRLEEFVGSFETLVTDPDFSTRLIPALLDAATLAELHRVAKAVPIEKLEMHEVQLFGRFVVHDLPEFTAFQSSLIDKVSDWAGEQLEASYNFFSMYTQFGECRPHLDSPFAKWTLDICIDQSDVWPIQISQVVPWPEPSQAQAVKSPIAIKDDPSLDFTAWSMEPGDALLFSGSSQWHYREALPRDGVKRHCDLLFLHFYPAAARDVVRPRRWADHFGIPELSRFADAELAD